MKGFVLDGKAYMGTGYNGSIVFNDFYCYDPSNDTWTAKANFPGLARGASGCFSIGNYGYLGGGYDGNATGVFYQDYYRYSVSANSWTPVANYPGSGPAYVGCFSIGNKGYVGTGGVYGGPYFSNFYEFSDNTTSINDEISMNNEYFVNYDVKNNVILINGSTKSNDLSFNLYDLSGKQILIKKISDGSNFVNLSNDLKAGIYFYCLIDSKGIHQTNKLMLIGSL